MQRWLARIIRLAGAAVIATPVIAAPPPTPSLIVAISVDQFSAELYRRYRDSFTGGLRVLSGGVVYPVAYQSHAATETCPGHSTILTGRHPAGTGIVANAWLDRQTGAMVYCVALPGSSGAGDRGPQNLRATTLGDWMKQASASSRVFAVSGKDRAAIMMGGHHSDGTYWWAAGKGFESSDLAANPSLQVSEFTNNFNGTLFAHWARATPALWPQPTAGCQAKARPHRFGQIEISGEVPPSGARPVDHGPAYLPATDFQDQLRSSPLFDQVVLDFASQLVDREQLGHGPSTDLLAVSLSATDYVGHRYGSGGAEMCTQLAALDAALGRFIERLATLGVPFIVMLTADHGSTDAAEREHEHDQSAHRIDTAALLGQLNQSLRQAFHLEYDPIFAEDRQQLYVKVERDAALAGKVHDAAVAWLKAQPEVRHVFTRPEVEAATVPPGTTPDRLTIVQRFHESYDPERSGDIAVTYAERATFSSPTKPGDFIAGHGAPWDYDRQVPILFWWPGVTHEDRAVPAETVDIAPTLAALIHVKRAPVDGRCLNLAAGPGDSCD